MAQKDTVKILELYEKVFLLCYREKHHISLELMWSTEKLYPAGDCDNTSCDKAEVVPLEADNERIPLKFLLHVGLRVRIPPQTIVVNENPDGSHRYTRNESLSSFMKAIKSEEDETNEAATEEDDVAYDETISKTELDQATILRPDDQMEIRLLVTNPADENELLSKTFLLRNNEGYADISAIEDPLVIEQKLAEKYGVPVHLVHRIFSEVYISGNPYDHAWPRTVNVLNWATKAASILKKKRRFPTETFESTTDLSAPWKTFLSGCNKLGIPSPPIGWDTALYRYALKEIASIKS